jgi:hypothetical protein
MKSNVHYDDPRDRRQNWDEEEYYEYLVDQYDQDQDEEEDIQGDL